MQYALTEEQEALRQLARKVAREEIEPGANERDEKGNSASLMGFNGWMT
ncbi:MAG: acyl-CoA dehydrogenase family protein [Chloroflexi bacterium]|nr:acyl-CoA dehydrogenase family protein [Chloroflexota bacterium]